MSVPNHPPPHHTAPRTGQAEDPYVEEADLSWGSPLQGQDSAHQFTGSPGPDGAPPQKRRRKQLVACDACRLRRVRCDRTPGREGCDECTKKNIKCTDDYVSTKPKPKRTGKLIQQAKNIYGDTTFGTGQPSPQSSPDTPVPPTPKDHSGPPFPSPVETAVARYEVGAYLSSYLVDTYLNTTGVQVLILDWDAFRERWDRAGKRSSGMGEWGECLCMTLEAFASRVTDSPQIVGPGAPSLQNQKDWRGQDLNVWGKRRDAICELMLQRAIKAADERGVWRVPNVDNIVNLFLLAHLSDRANYGFSKARFFHAAGAELMRDMANRCIRAKDNDSDESKALLGGRLWWYSFVKDSAVSAHHGTTPHLTVFDIETFCPRILQTDYSSIWRALHSDDAIIVARSGVAGLFGQLASLARSTFESLTGPVAKRKDTIDEAFVRSLWNGTEQAKALSTFFASRSRKLFKTRLAAFDLWSRGLCTTRIDLLATAHREIEERLDAEESGMYESQGAGNVGSARREYVVRLRGLRESSALHFLQGGREMVPQVKKALETGTMFAGGWVWEQMSYFTRHLIDMPCAEEGGPDEWNAETKINDIQTLLEGMKLIGWSWPDWASDLNAYEVALQAFIDQSNAFSIPRVNAGVMSNLRSDPCAVPVVPGEFLPSNRPGSRSTATGGHDGAWAAAPPRDGTAWAVPHRDGTAPAGVEAGQGNQEYLTPQELMNFDLFSGL